MALALDQGMQLLAHCNGDAAAGQYLSVLEQLEREREAHLERPVMIHAQLLDLDQLDKVKELGVVPSFFAAHVYHWGDVHVQNLGRSGRPGSAPPGRPWSGTSPSPSTRTPRCSRQTCWRRCGAE